MLLYSSKLFSFIYYLLLFFDHIHFSVLFNGGFGQLLTHNRGDHVPEGRVTVKASGNKNAY
jgi:hypothetical protein